MSKEHPLPESLGNTEIVLPPGVSCDRCNNRLSRLDRAFVTFTPVNFLRTMAGVRTKKDKLPFVEAVNGRISLQGERTIVVDAYDDTLFERTGPDEFRLHIKGAPLTASTLAPITRAIWKAALGCFYLHHGEEAFHPIMDPVREMVLSTRRLAGFIFVAKHGTPSPAVTLTCDANVRYEGIPMCPVRVELWGLVFITELWCRERVVFDPGIRDLGLLIEFPTRRTALTTAGC